MQKPFTIYAIPYAGGHSMVYRNLKLLLDPSVNFIALEMPGRGKRVQEPLLYDMELLADDLFNQIKDNLSDNNYAIFGHSMGALLAYLTAVKIKESSYPLPMHLFCSGHGAPSVKKIDLLTDEPKHKLPTDKFWNYIDSLGALPPELKDHSELMDYFEPIIRADIRALESYEYKKTESSLDIPISVFYGLSDKDTPVDGVLPWQLESKHGVTFYPLPGGHFGIFDHLNELKRVLEQAKN
jgi:surfactin synthase thioesterase subunit